MSTTAQKVPRQMHCTCCGLTKPRKGCKTVAGTGLVCAECVAVLSEDRAVAAKLAPAPKLIGRPPAESREPYRGYALQPKPNAPALAARDAAIPPGVKVTVRATPRGRFEVDPATVTSVFSALGPGRYLDGGRA